MSTINHNIEAVTAYPVPIHEEANRPSFNINQQRKPLRESTLFIDDLVECTVRKIVSSIIHNKAAKDATTINMISFFANLTKADHVHLIKTVKEAMSDDAVYDDNFEVNVKGLVYKFFIHENPKKVAIAMN